MAEQLLHNAQGNLAGQLGGETMTKTVGVYGLLCSGVRSWRTRAGLRPAGLRPAPCLQAPPRVGDGAPTGRSRWGKGKRAGF